MKILEMLLHMILRPCPFHQVTGFYCPGCGGTRSVIALLHGHILQSLIYHPIVLYVVVMFLYAMLKTAYSRITKNPAKRYHFRPAYAYIALIILGINFLIKNIALAYGLDLLTALSIL
ncbi:Protein of unknown function [Lachnospiraceae bacterium A10]|jgi:hypothetical protein|nr:Protein of unknown function [Lachnospiraceae bacterium A10]